ncbi:autotransporter domain-containing protein [Sneathiella sp. P13V-1]|uniref:autotransporter outer membrane beta-barrel domain-containing protein n=1 Tax=Sneathiella sp. P13V-1 TaxID=2697366 RepID=UPI00187B73B8|nr:autotransporter outer membrane beta-barrel domain-containing protein [Sneathiella sp. P13V-1]MBE7638351.1 autotransporter domain-containing protein [Sneathiella sp. P13V-1]
MKRKLLATAAMTLVLSSGPTPSFADVLIYNPGVTDIDGLGPYTNNGNIDAIVVDGDHGTITNTGTINDGNAAGGSTDTVNILTGITLDTLDNSGTISNVDGGLNPLQVSGTITNLNNSGTIQSVGGAGSTLLVSGQITVFNNTGGIIESTGSSRAIWLTSDQTSGWTLNGIVRNTDGANSSASDAIRIATSQSQQFSNSGTISGTNDGIELTGDANFSIANTGSIDGVNQYGIHVDGNSDLTLINSGTLSGSVASVTVVDPAGVGRVDITNNTGGLISGKIRVVSDAAHNIDLAGGTVNGDIELSGLTGNSFSMGDGAVLNGDADLGFGAAHTVTLSGGTINGELDVGSTAGTVITVAPVAGKSISLLNAGTVAFRGEASTFNMTGAGTFIVNGNFVDSLGADNDLLLDINNGRIEFAGDSTIEGGIDLDGASLDLNSVEVTVSASTDIAADTVLEFDLDGSNPAQLNNGADDVTITFHDNGTVQINSVANVTVGDQYTLIDATGAGGGSNLTVDPTAINLVESSGQYDFTLEKVGDTLVLNVIASTLGLSPNALKVQQVSSVAFAGDAPLLAALNALPDAESRNEAFQRLDNHTKTALVLSALRSQQFQRTVVGQRIFNRSTSNVGVAAGDDMSAAQKNIWLQGLYFHGEQDDKDGFDGYEARSVGFAVGADKQFSLEGYDQLLVGVSFGYDHVKSEVNNQDSDTVSDNYHLALYSSLEDGANTFFGQVALGYSQFDSSRGVVVGGIDRTAKGDFDGYQFGLNMGTSRKIGFGGIDFEPTISANYDLLYTEDYVETGAGAANLDVDAEVFQQLALGTSIAISKTFHGEGLAITPRLLAGYSYGILVEEIETTQKFTGGGSSFTTNNIKPERHSGYIGADLTLFNQDRLELNMAYKYSLREGFEGHNADLKLTYSF